MFRWIKMQPIDAFVDGGAASCQFWFCGINPRERGQIRKSWGERKKTMKGWTEKKVLCKLAQDREEEMRREDRKGEENIRRITKGETLTSEMLSGLNADMTTPVPIDGAIGLPSPTVCCPLVEQHSAVLLSLRALFEITSGFVSIGFILLFYPSSKVWRDFPAPGGTFRNALGKHDSGRIF